MIDVDSDGRGTMAARARALMPVEGAGEAVAAIMAMPPGARALLVRLVPDVTRGDGLPAGAAEALAAVEGVAAGRLTLAPDPDRMGVMALRPPLPGETPADLPSVMGAIRANADAGGRLIEAAEARRGGDA